MSLYSNGSKVGSLYKNGKKIDSIYKNGKMIFLSNRNQLSKVFDKNISTYMHITQPYVSSDETKMLCVHSNSNVLLDISKPNITVKTILTVSGSASKTIFDDDDNIIACNRNSILKYDSSGKLISENDSLTGNSSDFSYIKGQNSAKDYIVFFNSATMAIVDKKSLQIKSTCNLNANLYNLVCLDGYIVTALNDTVIVYDEKNLSVKSKTSINGQNSAVGISYAKNSIFVFNSDYSYFLKYDFSSGVLSNPKKIITNNPIYWSLSLNDGHFAYFKTTNDNIIHKFNSDGKEISNIKMSYYSNASIFANRKNIYLTYNIDNYSTNICRISQY